MSELPYKKDWIHDGQILRYGFHETSRATADIWFEDMAQVFRAWDDQKPLHLLIDVRMQGMFVSAQALIRARQVSGIRPDLPGRTAVLIASPIGAQVISSLIRTGLTGTLRQRLVFSDESRAIQWLLDKARR